MEEARQAVGRPRKHRVIQSTFRTTEDRMDFIKKFAKNCTKAEKKLSKKIVSKNDVINFAVDLLKLKMEQSQVVVKVADRLIKHINNPVAFSTGEFNEEK